MNNVHFSSKTPEWSTPQPLFDKLNKEFSFTLDVCATAENAKCPAFYSMADNSLVQPWTGTCFMNPPYGRQIGLWVAKAATSVASGTTTIGLLPSRTDTKWWHRYVLGAATEIRYLLGRLKFGGCKHNAPFPSAIAIWKPAP